VSKLFTRVCTLGVWFNVQGSRQKNQIKLDEVQAGRQGAEPAVLHKLGLLARAVLGVCCTACTGCPRRNRDDGGRLVERTRRMTICRRPCASLTEMEEGGAGIMCQGKT